MRGLHPEVAKNLVLAGMNVTLVDSNVVTEDDLYSNFFLTEADLDNKVSHKAILCAVWFTVMCCTFSLWTS